MGIMPDSTPKSRFDVNIIVCPVTILLGVTVATEPNMSLPTDVLALEALDK
jgi:hypothetical protein